MTYIPETLRQEVAERANNQCEYCLLHEQDSIYSHEVDHIIPEKHRGETIADNLCYACLECNRNKDTDFGSFDPETEEIALLFHPRKDTWVDHFELDSARIVPTLYINALSRIKIIYIELNIR